MRSLRSKFLDSCFSYKLFETRWQTSQYHNAVACGSLRCMGATETSHGRPTRYRVVVLTFLFWLRVLRAAWRLCGDIRDHSYHRDTESTEEAQRGIAI